MVDITTFFQNLSFEVKAILFDWGNTVMKVFPGQNGPMALWPEVSAIDGIEAILAGLKKNYQIILLSNAQDSDRARVAQALQRVNLARYFHTIFTPRELKERKPAPGFYLNALNQLELEPENALMIGDDYENDIIAAKQVGLWTIWYNPHHQELPTNSFPYHDAEVSTLQELASVIHKNMSF